MAGAGMMTDPGAIRTCSLSGLATMRGKEAELLQIRAAMLANIAEADAVTNQADLARTIIFGLQLTKASCDAVLGIVGALAEGPAKGVATVYFGVSPMAEIAGKTIGGQRVGGAEVAKASTAGLNAAVQMSSAGADIKAVVDLKRVQSDLIIDAVNSDFDALKKDIYSYGEKLGKFTLSALEKKSVAKVYEVAKQLSKAAMTYAAAYEDFRASDMTEAMEGAKRTFRVRQAMVERQLIVLQHAISQCEGELARDGILEIDPFRQNAMDRLRSFRPSFPTIGPAR